MKYLSLFSGIGGLYNSGMTQKELAGYYNCSQKHISVVMKKLGIKSRVPKNTKQNGVDNPNWKGDKAGYAALHIRIERLKGKPKKCEECGSTKASRYEWANLTGKYNDPDDYKRLCRSCHAKHDNIIKNIIK